MEFRLEYNELTHFSLSVIEQKGAIANLKRVCRIKKEPQFRLVYSKEEITAAVQRLADTISNDYAGQELLLVVVLKGAFFFAADLSRRLRLPLEIDFVKLASYIGRETSGMVKITKDVETIIAGKNVLVVEDIIDTGLTVDFLLRYLAGRGPKSLKVCTLIDKRQRRQSDVTADYTGLFCNKGFLVGYGLDMDESYRELDAIYEVADSPSCGGLNDNSM
jgi:hypoxanthine phosphoribosyltransferase